MEAFKKKLSRQTERPPPNKSPLLQGRFNNAAALINMSKEKDLKYSSNNIKHTNHKHNTLEMIRNNSTHNTHVKVRDRILMAEQLKNPETNK